MTSQRDRALLTIQIVVWVFMIGAASISFTHIVHVSQMIGLGWESWTAPFLIDGIAVVGKVSMLPRFSPLFRRSGFRLLMLGGLLSLAANVAAGSNWGERGFGVLVVAGFMMLESHATKATRTTAVVEQPTTRKLDPQVAAARAAKAKVTRERNRLAAMTPAQRAAVTKARKATAPVSPGRVPVDSLNAEMALSEH